MLGLLSLHDCEDGPLRVQLIRSVCTHSHSRRCAQGPWSRAGRLRAVSWVSFPRRQLEEGPSSQQEGRRDTAFPAAWAACEQRGQRGRERPGVRHPEGGAERRSSGCERRVLSRGVKGHDSCLYTNVLDVVRRTNAGDRGEIRVRSHGNS